MAHKKQTHGTVMTHSNVTHLCLKKSRPKKKTSFFLSVLGHFFFINDVDNDVAGYDGTVMTHSTYDSNVS